MKSLRKLISIVSLGALTAAMIVWLSGPMASDAEEIKQQPIPQEKSTSSGLAWPKLKAAIEVVREALWNAKDSGYIVPDDFEKLSFLSGDIEHGWNPKYKNALEENLRHYFIVGPNMEPPLKEEIRTLVNEGKSSEPFVTLRRYKYTRRGDMDFLYLVIPSIEKTKCGEKGIDNLSIEISHDVILTDQKVLEGCLRMKDGTISLFLPIIYRLRISDNSKWDMEHRFKAFPQPGFRLP